MHRLFIRIRSLWRRRPWVGRGLIIATALLCIGLLGWHLSTAPASFPEKIVIEIKSGDTVNDVARTLREHEIVRSAFMFRSLVLILGRERGVMRGFYLFDERVDLFAVTNRLISGDYQLDSVRVTLPEGVTRFVMADLLAAKVLGFDRTAFLQKTKNLEGQLFPDTYIFLPYTTADMVIKTLSDNYEKKVAPLRDDIEDFGKTEQEILAMASILELEARQFETRRMIAGVLWRRIAIGMPLQVDVSFLVINGKATPDLTLADLAIDSPYNSYKYKGLPPTPLVNPGLESIKAAITPIKTTYVYFLSDDEGVMHYARTLQEHVANRRKYLD